MRMTALRFRRLSSSLLLHQREWRRGGSSGCAAAAAAAPSVAVMMMTAAVPSTTAGVEIISRFAAQPMTGTLQRNRGVVGGVSGGGRAKANSGGKNRDCRSSGGVVVSPPLSLDSSSSITGLEQHDHHHHIPNHDRQRRERRECDDESASSPASSPPPDFAPPPPFLSATSSFLPSLLDSSCLSLLRRRHALGWLRERGSFLFKAGGGGAGRTTTPSAAAGLPLLSLGGSQQKRCLNLHECRSMELMREMGIRVPRGAAATTAREAEQAAQALGEDIDYVVKAQVLAGGRGLGYFKENGFQGGVHVCTSPKAVREVAEKMLGKTLVTKQTGEAGKPCTMVLVCERFYIRREKYIAFLIDRGCGGPAVIGSAVGGTSIEDIAAKHPDAIVKMAIGSSDKGGGLSEQAARDFASKLGFEGEGKVEKAAECIMGLYRFFEEKDCSLVEVNPFAETHDGRVMVCDAKANFDENAAFRQKKVFELRDTSQEDPREVAAQRFDLNYVGLDGNIGCMVNGAGLAMATMDILKLNGGNPANFLDVGGGADKRQVVEALRILQNDPQVKVVMVNIFGGIMRCDVIALGILHASQEVGLSKPLVVRLEGTNQEVARELLDNSGLRMLFIDDLDEAAKKAVKMTEILRLADSAELDVSFAM